jgi:hypothetical protein
MGAAKPYFCTEAIAMKLRPSIRDLFWLVLVTVLCIGWWLNYRQMSDKLERLEQGDGDTR